MSNDGEINEMVKRLAKVAMARSIRYGHAVAAVEPPWLPFVDEARVYIAAMREPTEAMLNAAHLWGERWGALSPSQQWQAMVEEALK